jgi:hypothetical protein
LAPARGGGVERHEAQDVTVCRVVSGDAVLPFARRHLTTRCWAAKPVEIRHSPATVTIALDRPIDPMGVRTPIPQRLLNLREKG